MAHAPHQRSHRRGLKQTPTMQIDLINNLSDTVYVNITGRSLADNNQFYILGSDGNTAHLLTGMNINKLQTPITPTTDYSIALQVGKSTSVKVPKTAGGRVWFSLAKPLQFMANPAVGANGYPALVEPSVANDSDPNIKTRWDFCEFTFNDDEFLGNLSYVDFVSLPVSISLQSTADATPKTVQGLKSTGFADICGGLTALPNRDWAKLIYPDASAPVRVLSPNLRRSMAGYASLLDGHFEDYVTQVWKHYSSTPLTINTQNKTYGVMTGTVAGANMVFKGPNNTSSVSFTKPSTADIFSCSTGPFSPGQNTLGDVSGLTARLAAAFNRSTLLSVNTQPAAKIDSYYTIDSPQPTNEYARILHRALDRGYAFPFDDVNSSQDNADPSVDAAGILMDPSPSRFTVAVGGAQQQPAPTRSTVPVHEFAHRGAQRPAKQAAGGAQRHHHARRGAVDLSWAAGAAEKAAVAALHDDGRARADPDPDPDLEANALRGKLDGEHGRLGSGPPGAAGGLLSAGLGPLASLLPAAWRRRVAPPWAAAPPVLEGGLGRAGALHPRLRPVLDGLAGCAVAFMSSSLRAFASRVAVFLFLLVFYFVLPLIQPRAAPGSS